MKYRAPLSFETGLSKVEMGSASKTVMRFNLLKSRQNLMVLSLFITTVIREAYGDDDRVMMPEEGILSMSVLVASVAVVGIV